MTREIWVTSDTHFNQANILKFSTGRGEDFDSLSEMNEVMVERWNSVVKAGDYVYHLGDVFFGPKEEFKTLWPRLNGAKRLIVGNHDDVKFLSSGSFFKKVMLWRMFPEYKTVLTHIPLLMNVDESRKYQINVHGHLHRNKVDDPRYYNAGVELNDYTPLHLYTLLESLQQINQGE
jgi:calcineurin-like phosphoesterase family protein